MIRRASFGLLYFQKSGLKGIGEKEPLLALLKADGHISPAQLDHLADAELSVNQMCIRDRCRKVALFKRCFLMKP